MDPDCRIKPHVSKSRPNRWTQIAESNPMSANLGPTDGPRLQNQTPCHQIWAQQMDPDCRIKPHVSRSGPNRWARNAESHPKIIISGPNRWAQNHNHTPRSSHLGPTDGAQMRNHPHSLTHTPKSPHPYVLGPGKPIFSTNSDAMVIGPPKQYPCFFAL
jgi:hypothetical protein